MARTLFEVESEITKTQYELKNVHGSKTEVYARITGYYRPTHRWNIGKREEFRLRKPYEVK